MRARKLSEMVEQRIVTKTVLEFEIDGSYVEPMRALRVTIDAKGLTIHDRWDKEEKDFTVEWSDLQASARLWHTLEEERKDL